MGVAKTAVGVFAGIAARSIAMGFLAGGTYVLAVSFGVFVLGIVVAYGLYYLDNKYGISKSLIE
ncbi:hypothetical protein [Xenorhabdus bovienii]